MSKKTTKKSSDKKLVAKAKTAKTSTKKVEKKVAPSFEADVKDAAKPATTIKSPETARSRKVVATIENNADNQAELNRIYESTYRRANRSEMQTAWHLEDWIKRLNPTVDVRTERPSKGVKIQARFIVTLGEDTIEIPREGFFSTNG